MRRRETCEEENLKLWYEKYIKVPMLQSSPIDEQYPNLSRSFLFLSSLI